MTNKRVSTSYLIELSLALLLYGGLLVGMNLIVRQWQPQGTLRIGVALLPMLGCLAALWAIMRQVRRMDELQRRVQFEAISFAFAATALLTFAYGFLEGAGLPRFPVFAVWPLMAGNWILGLLLSSRRYA